MTTASVQLIGSGTDDGVPWRIETSGSADGLRATRWHTPATRLASGFLLLAQVVPGSAESTPDFADGIAAFAHLQMLQSVGFSKNELPGWDTATSLQSGNEVLQAHFLSRTSNPQAAQTWLTASIAEVVAQWASQDPIQNLRPLSHDHGALYVLVRQDGLWVIHIPALVDPERINALAGLGKNIARRATGAITVVPGYNCPSCGGPGLRQISHGMLLCSYCGSQFAAPQRPIAAPRGTRWIANRIPSTRSVFAMMSLIAAIVAWTLVPFVGALLAIGFGVQGLREIRSSQGQLHGRWLAAVGIVAGTTQLLLVCLLIALALFAGVSTQR